MTDYRCHACDRDVRLLPHRRLPDGRLTCRHCDVMPRCPTPGCPWRWRHGPDRPCPVHYDETDGPPRVDLA